MELSPAPTITSLSPERAEDSDALTAVSSALEGSPMDTSSLASCTLEEAGGGEAGGAPPPPQGPPGTPQGPPPAPPGPPDASHPTDDSSPPASSSESSSTRDSAVAISGADSRGILEEPLPSTSSEEEDPLAGISLPEGVDPSFLAALPDDIRREVLQNQLGIRPPARAPPTPSPAPPVVANPGLTEVSPEFLAALPPAIQEEVLAQQRAEQQRRELAQATSSDAPMDPVTFIQTLPSELRRSVLEDMEDSVLAVMPPDIAAEAQALRREQEARQRQLMHERLFGHSSTSALSAILRSPAFTSRLSGNRGVQYTRLAVQRGGTFHMGGSSSHSRPSGSSVDSLLRLRGRLLLDHEALSCLLVLLFVDEPKLNTSRLHRVLRNLCYHAPTRGWVVRSLLSILQRSSESELCLEAPRAPPAPEEQRPQRRAGARTGATEPRALDLLHRVEARSSGQLSWLSVSMDAALGCRTNIFQIQRAPGRKHTEKHAAAAGSAVHIHPQAAPVVCRHVLDTLIQLAKVFPSHFTQQRGREAASDGERDRGGGGTGPKTGGSPCPSGGAPQTVTATATTSATGPGGLSTDFWDLLVKLDNMNVSRKGKGSAKAGPGAGGPEGEALGLGLEASPLGQLMNMLSHGVIRRSALLTEKLLRLLSLISIALPEGGKGGEGAAAPPGTGAGAAAAAGGPPGAPSPPAVTPAGAAAGAAVASGGTAAGGGGAAAAPTKSAKSPAKGGEVGGGGSPDPRMAATGLTESQLQLSVEVLTSHSCSEEGLEDAANVLLQLSRGDPGTRDTVLRLLLSGARQLGATLCRQIGTLLAELREYNLEQQRRAQSEAPSPEGLPDEQPPSAKLKGKMQSRFDTAESVVIVASQKRALGGRELQLPSMSVLTSKTSTQRFFLRVLQVIIQLRDDTRRAHKKAKQAGRLGAGGLGAAGSIQAAVRQLEAEADAIIQMVREGQRARRQQQADTSEAGPADGAPRRDESPMDVDQPSPAPQDAPSVGSEGSQGGERDERPPPELPLLSEQLCLDELWDMLGECLKELEESHDQHAVLAGGGSLLLGARHGAGEQAPGAGHPREPAGPHQGRAPPAVPGPPDPRHPLLARPLLLPRAFLHAHLGQPAPRHPEVPALRRNPPDGAEPDPAPVHHPPGRRPLRRPRRLHPRPRLRRQAQVFSAGAGAAGRGAAQGGHGRARPPRPRLRGLVPRAAPQVPRGDEKPTIHRLRGRGGPGRRGAAARVVYDHLAGDVQPNVRAVPHLAGRQGHLHHQPLVPLQPQPPQLLQVCGAHRGQGRLRQPPARVLLHPLLLQAHPGQVRPVHGHGERGLPLLPGPGLPAGERCLHPGLRPHLQHRGAGVRGVRGAGPETQRSQCAGDGGEQEGVRPPCLPDAHDRSHQEAAGRLLGGLLRDHPQAPHLHLHGAGAGAAHLGAAHHRHRRPQGQHRVPQIPGQLHPDPVVLAGAALLRPGGPRQVPAVRDGDVQGAPAGLRRPRGHERHPEVPDPPRRPLHRPPALGAHLLQPAGPAGLRELREAAADAAAGHPGVLRGLRAGVAPPGPPRDPRRGTRDGYKYIYIFFGFVGFFFFFFFLPPLPLILSVAPPPPPRPLPFFSSVFALFCEV